MYLLFKQVKWIDIEQQRGSCKIFLNDAIHMNDEIINLNRWNSCKYEYYLQNNKT